MFIVLLFFLSLLDFRFLAVFRGEVGTEQSGVTKPRRTSYHWTEISGLF